MADARAARGVTQAAAEGGACAIASLRWAIAAPFLLALLLPKLRACVRGVGDKGWVAMGGCGGHIPDGDAAAPARKGCY